MCAQVKNIFWISLVSLYNPGELALTYGMIPHDPRGGEGFGMPDCTTCRPPAAAVYTPMIEAGSFWLKCENLQPMGAFKIRGAYNMISQLPKEQLERGVITYSSGNHGQAVALAARKVGAHAVIVMPTTAPQVKIDGCKSYGAEVIMEGTTSLHRQARAEKEARERGLRQLEVAVDEGPATSSAHRPWSPIRGAFFSSGLLVFVGSLLVLGYTYLQITEVSAFTEDKTSVLNEIEEAQIDSMELMVTIETFVALRKEGLGEQVEPFWVTAQKIVLHKRNLMIGAVGAAVAGLLAMIGSLFIPAPKAG